MIRKRFVSGIVSIVFVLSTAARAFGGPAQPADPPEEHGPSSDRLPSHRFQWAPRSANDAQIGFNFGLLQLALGGFNVAAELRYRRIWFEYSHGIDLTLNHLAALSMTQTEREQNLHVFVPYTTGFGVGMTIVDELWLGVEFKTHHYEVNAPGGPVSGYQTYSVGPVLGYKFFIWKGLYADVYFRYWPNVATSLDGNKITLEGARGAVTHDAHDFALFANASLGYAFNL